RRLSCSTNGSRWAWAENGVGQGSRPPGKLPMLSWWLCRARPSCLRLFWHCMRAAASRTFCTAGSSRPIRMAMMAITTSSSISVNAERPRRNRLMGSLLEQNDNGTRKPRHVRARDVSGDGLLREGQKLRRSYPARPPRGTGSGGGGGCRWDGIGGGAVQTLGVTYCRPTSGPAPGRVRGQRGPQSLPSVRVEPGLRAGGGEREYSPFARGFAAEVTYA